MSHLTKYSLQCYNTACVQFLICESHPTWTTQFLNSWGTRYALWTSINYSSTILTKTLVPCIEFNNNLLLSSLKTGKSPQMRWRNTFILFLVSWRRTRQRRWFQDSNISHNSTTLDYYLLLTTWKETYYQICLYQPCWSWILSYICMHSLSFYEHNLGFSK